jgi:ribosomal protein S19
MVGLKLGGFAPTRTFKDAAKAKGHDAVPAAAPAGK